MPTKISELMRDDMQIERVENRSPLKRLLQAITLTLMACFGSAGYFALRALAWHRDGADVGRATLTGALAALMIVGGLAIFYTFVGAFGLRRRIDWISLQLGALVGAALYGVYSAVGMPIGASLDPGERALQGAIDGLLVGAGIGLLVTIVNGRPARLTFNGLSRFVGLFVLVLLILWGVIVAAGILRSPLVYAVLLPLLLIVRGVVKWSDRRTGERHQPADQADDGWHDDTQAYTQDEEVYEYVD